MPPTISEHMIATMFSACSKNARTGASAPPPGAVANGAMNVVLPAAPAMVQICASPPGTDRVAMKTTAARPLNLTQNWTTSFQITAFTPPSAVYTVTTMPSTTTIVLTGNAPDEATSTARQGT